VELQAKKNTPYVALHGVWTSKVHAKLVSFKLNVPSVALLGRLAFPKLFS